MALENSVIVDKLKEEGINENLGNGLTFETEDDLTSWVGNYKSGLPEPVKKLEDYTKEERDELAKDPTFKGAKGLQGYSDSIRNKKKPETKPIEKKPDVEPEWAKNIREQNEKILNQNESENFNKLVIKVAKEEDLNETYVARVRKGLKNDATEADIVAEIKSYKKEMADLGIKEFGTPGGGSGGDNLKTKKLAEKWRDKKLKQQKK